MVDALAFLEANARLAGLAKGAERPAEHKGERAGNDPGMTRGDPGESQVKRRGGASPPQVAQRLGLPMLPPRSPGKAARERIQGKACRSGNYSAICYAADDSREQRNGPIAQRKNSGGRRQGQGASPLTDGPPRCAGARTCLYIQEKTAKGDAPRRQIGCSRFPE